MAEPSPVATFSTVEPTSRRPVVLVVLDDSERSALLKLSLASRGWEVVRAHSCEQARARVLEQRDGRVDALLTDLVLPDGSAFGLQRALAASASITAVLTWGNQHGIRERIAASGFDVHLVRPISAEEIDVVLRRALGAAREAVDRRTARVHRIGAGARG